jgi:phosphate/phosphite/phosphonate ABC transporter binding protein
MLRLLTFLSPSIPIGLYEAIADYLAASLDVDVSLASDVSRSGPGPGTANPFAEGTADVGFVCAPSYVWMADRQPPSVVLAGVAPVHDDVRNGGRPEYFSELVVHPSSAAKSFDDLAGQRFAFNDPSSLSGYHCVLDRLVGAQRDTRFFGEVRQSGSHHRSLELILAGEVDVAAIDANALHIMRDMGFEVGVRVLETLGPYPVQPVVVRRTLDPDLRGAIRAALLEMHFASGGEPLRRFGVDRFVPVEDADYNSVRDQLRARERATLSNRWL